MPQVIIIEGPNGAGKTTTAPVLLDKALQIDHFVNADTIAAGLSVLCSRKGCYPSRQSHVRTHTSSSE